MTSLRRLNRTALRFADEAHDAVDRHVLLSDDQREVLHCLLDRIDPVTGKCAPSLDEVGRAAGLDPVEVRSATWRMREAYPWFRTWRDPAGELCFAIDLDGMTGPYIWLMPSVVLGSRLLRGEAANDNGGES